MGWLLLLLLGGGALAVASGGGARPANQIDDKAIEAVTRHALVAEGDINVLRKLQDLLSHAGYFDLALLVKNRGDAFDLLPGGKMETVHAPKAIPVPPDPNKQTLDDLRVQLQTAQANYQRVAQTPYGLTHPAFLAQYQKNILDLQAKIKSLGG